MLLEAIAKRLSAYPIYSQVSDDPIIPVKLFDIFGACAWYLTEYDPEDRVAFGYRASIHRSKWGHISIDGLARGDERQPIVQIDPSFSPA